MSPQIERPDPPYMQVVADIRRRIESGVLKEGDHVPSARQIVRDWGISLATATKVLAALRSEGLARGVAGVGTVVSAPPQQSARDNIRAARNTGRIYPEGAYAKITDTGLVEAPAAVADALGVEPGARVVRRHRVTYREDAPLSASTSWFAGDLAAKAPRLLEAERIRQGTAGYIEETTGRRVASGRDSIAAREGTAEECAELGLPTGSIVLLGRNWYLDADGDVIEYGEYLGPANKPVTYEYVVD